MTRNVGYRVRFDADRKVPRADQLRARRARDVEVCACDGRIERRRVDTHRFDATVEVTGAGAFARQFPIGARNGKASRSLAGRTNLQSGLGRTGCHAFDLHVDGRADRHRDAIPAPFAQRRGDFDARRSDGDDESGRVHRNAEVAGAHDRLVVRLEQGGVDVARERQRVRRRQVRQNRERTGQQRLMFGLVAPAQRRIDRDLAKTSAVRSRVAADQAHKGRLVLARDVATDTNVQRVARAYRQRIGVADDFLDERLGHS